MTSLPPSCAAVRQYLLGSEHPDQPGPADARHLAGCPACQAWLRRLVRLERQLPQVRVPSCPPPSALLARILTEPTGDTPPLVRPPLPQFDQRRVREGGRQKLALALALAATLTLFTLAWWAERPGPTRSHAARGTATVRPYDREIAGRLRPARTPAQRVEALAHWAEEILVGVRTRGHDAGQVAELAERFDRLVRGDLLHFAHEVPAAQREAVLSPVARRLREAESAASHLAAEWARRHPGSVEPVRRIAAAAHEADRRLRVLVEAARA